MHIALNALCITNRSGTGRYAWGLIEGLLRLQAHPKRISVLIPPDFSLPETWQHADWVRFYSIPVHTTFQRIVWEQIVLSGWLRQIKPDLLHSTAFIAPILRHPAFKQVVTLHDLAFLLYPETIPLLRRGYYRWIIPASRRKADAVITDSRAIQNEVNTRLEGPSTIFPIHLGVDPDRFHETPNESDSEIRSRHGLVNPFFLFVGTREPRKNLETLLQAYHRASKRGLRGNLAIVGRYGWMERQKIAHKNIRWLGHVADSDLPALYRGALAVVAPSLYEGFDLPSVEARACGSPILASDIPVHREILQDSARFVACRDAEAWASALLECEKTPLISKKPTVRSWEQMAAETMEVYRSVLCSTV